MGEKKKVSVLERFLHRVEVMGNKIPNPMLLFIYLCIAVIAISAVCSIFHVSAVNPVTGELVEVVNLFSKDGFVRMLTTFVTNFTGTSALGLTLTCMLGVGVAEASGLFHVALRGLAKAKGSDLKVIAIFCFVCVMADCTGGAGFVVMPPLGALIWAAMGRNPMAGMLAAYASVSGAFASNLMITSMDVVNMGYTEAAAKLPEQERRPASRTRSIRRSRQLPSGHYHSGYPGCGKDRKGRGAPECDPCGHPCCQCRAG